MKIFNKKYKTLKNTLKNAQPEKHETKKKKKENVLNYASAGRFTHLLDAVVER